MNEKDATQEFKDALEKIKTTDKITQAQYVTEMVAHHCVSTIVVMIVHSLVPKDTLSLNKRAQLYVGAWAVSGLAADNASEWAAANIGKKLKFAKRLVHAVRYGSKMSEEPAETPPVTEGPKTEE